MNQNYFQTRKERSTYYSRNNYINNYYSSTGNFANSVYELLRRTTVEKRSMLSQSYLYQIEKDLVDIRIAKGDLMRSLFVYGQNTQLDKMVMSNGYQGSTINLSELVGSMGASQGQVDLLNKLEKYQRASAKGQHTMNSILEKLTSGEMRYNIAVASDKGSFSQGKEFSLNLNAIFDLETKKFNQQGQVDQNGKHIFDLIVNKDQLQAVLQQGYSKKFNIGQQTRKDLSNNQLRTVLEIMGQTSAKGTVLERMIDSQVWNTQQSVESLSPGDAYERYIAQRFNAQYYLGEKWAHSSYSAAAGGDINFYGTSGKFYMIQAKTFNQSRNLLESYNEIGYRKHTRFDYMYGFQNLTNLNNIESALYAYQDRLSMYAKYGFEDTGFMDNLKAKRVEETMYHALVDKAKDQFTSSFEQDVGWID